MKRTFYVTKFMLSMIFAVLCRTNIELNANAGSSIKQSGQNAANFKSEGVEANKERISGERRATSDSLPTGLLAPYAGSYEPIGWMFCDGRQLSRTAYGPLFGVVGITFGAGDGSTTFNIPDFRNKFPLGSTSFNENGGVGGDEKVMLSVAELPAHRHTSSVIGLSCPATTLAHASFVADQRFSCGHQEVITDDTGSNQPHNNMPPYLKVGWIIKTL